ncbi:hypothetical protein Moror_8976 [Moniliophthora roreri MCA 2997]|uniref:Uncharacterized protein n=2 Tax=Moniliophthora roreri TaxID=221103 RepID=V2X1G1_MONRO|nr:hypothetical protein Moror_8976 [Moniliophthora roreri MCA 2997]KAI3615256.1 hypothetical protein WG66_003621 [Moniliophthora roreri]
MPAPDVSIPSQETRPVVGHVNLMVDTFLANVKNEDLRSIVRGVLSSGLPGIAPTFTGVARTYLGRNPLIVHDQSLVEDDSAGNTVPTEQFGEVLTRARSLYGVGMGFSGLDILASIVKSTVGRRWDENGEFAQILVNVDSDITQAIQSCKEEIDAGRVNDFDHARKIINNLRFWLERSFQDAQSWGREFPFERASYSAHFWKL